jgi:hypothetical protein
MNDAEIKVLVERMNNYLDGQKRIEGQLSMLVQMQLSLASQQEQINGLKTGQERLFERTDDAAGTLEMIRTKEIQPLRDEVMGSRRAVRIIAAVCSVLLAGSGAVYSQWKPWADDLAKAKAARDDQLAKYQYDVGNELRRTDNRLTVLEFRANNADQKGAK